MTQRKPGNGSETLSQDPLTVQDPRSALDRVARDSETLGSSSLARAARRTGDHFAGTDAPENDPIELWGRRIGRGLSLLGVIGLGWYVGTQLRLW